MAEVKRQAQAMPGGQFAAPAGFLGGELDHVGGAAGVESALQQARLAHDFEQEVAVIAARGRGQLVQEALDHPGHGAGSAARATARRASRAAACVCVSW